MSLVFVFFSLVKIGTNKSDKVLVHGCRFAMFFSDNMKDTKDLM